MTGLQTFDFQGDPVRVISFGGREAVVGQDACRCLGLGNPSSALARIPEKEKGITGIDTLGGQQQMIVLFEPGLFRLIFASRKRAAERFQDWVFNEVLPAIRRTGRYGPDLEPDAALTAISMVREARLTMGIPAAQALWARLGLPEVNPQPAAHFRRGRPSSPREHAAVLIVRRFLFKCCEVQTGGRVQARPLYRAYAAWAERRREQVMTETAFGRAMILAGCDRQSCTGARFYLDIQLRDGEMITTGAIGEA